MISDSLIDPSKHCVWGYLFRPEYIYDNKYNEQYNLALDFLTNSLTHIPFQSDSAFRFLSDS